MSLRSVLRVLIALMVTFYLGPQAFSQGSPFGPKGEDHKPAEDGRGGKATKPKPDMKFHDTVDVKKLACGSDCEVISTSSEAVANCTGYNFGALYNAAVANAQSAASKIVCDTGCTKVTYETHRSWDCEKGEATAKVTLDVACQKGTTQPVGVTAMPAVAAADLAKPLKPVADAHTKKGHANTITAKIKPLACGKAYITVTIESAISRCPISVMEVKELISEAEARAKDIIATLTCPTGCNKTKDTDEVHCSWKCKEINREAGSIEKKETPEYIEEIEVGYEIICKP